MPHTPAPIPNRPANSTPRASLPPVSTVVNLSLRRNFPSPTQPPKTPTFPISFVSLPLRPTPATCVFHPLSQPRFTGKERDTESGNDYFGARYYASSMGRWMSPDWSANPTSVPYADFSNPQSLNLYRYGANNPLVTVDKDGHCPPCIVVAAVIIGGAVVYTGYKAFKAFKKMIADKQKSENDKTHFIEEFQGPGDGNEQQRRYQNDQQQLLQDAADAGIKGVAAGDAIVSAGQAATGGVAESLTDPGNATDTMKESVTETLQTGNEVQHEQELPDAPTPHLPVTPPSPQPSPQPAPPPPPPPKPQT